MAIKNAGYDGEPGVSNKVVRLKLEQGSCANGV